MKKYIVKFVGKISGENVDDAINNFMELYYDFDGDWEVEEIKEDEE